MLNNFQISEHFNLMEFVSRDTQTVKIDDELIHRLEVLRKLLDVKIWVMSGYRTKEENERVGGHPESYHLYGRAADIYSADVTLDCLYWACIFSGFGGVVLERKKGIVHVDTRKGEAFYQILEE